MMFFTSTDEFAYEKGDVLDIAATLDINEYNGKKSVSVIIKDIKDHDDDAERILESGRIFEAFCRGSSVLPESSDFALLYRYLRENGGYQLKSETLSAKLG